MSAPNETPNVPRKPSARQVMSKIHFKKNKPKSEPTRAPLPPSPGPPPGSVPSPPRPVHFADGSGWRWGGPAPNPTNRIIHPLPRRPQSLMTPWLPQSYDFTASIPMPNILQSAASVSMPERNVSVPTTAGSSSQTNAPVPRSRRNALVPPPASTSQQRNAHDSTDQPVPGPSSGKRRRKTDPTNDEEDLNERPSKRRISKEIQNMAKSYRCM